MKVILTPVPKRVSKLRAHFEIGVIMVLKITFGFSVGFVHILDFHFTV